MYPEYEGHWKSETEFFCTNAELYLDISIDSNGNFSGIWDYYRFLYTIPWFGPAITEISVCGISNAPSTVSGWIDFDNNTGYLQCGDIGETSFTLTLSGEKMTFKYPSEWQPDMFKQSKIEKQ